MLDWAQIFDRFERGSMLYHGFQWLSYSVPFFSVFHSVLLRTLLGLGTGFVLSLLGGAWFIKESARFRSQVREDTPQSHQAKNDTPTMGGLFVLGSVFATTFLWCDLTRPEVWIFMGCLAGYGAIGFWDDIMKIRFKKGIKEKHKFLAQILVGLLVTVLWYLVLTPSTEISIPLVPSLQLSLGLLLIPWATYILIGTSNAVNLTDGLDGLAIGSLLANYGTFAVICYLSGSYVYAQQLSIPYVHTSEIALIGGILVGASLGFLWYNAYPAQVFMGDVGSLALGSGLALMALMARQELLLAITGGVFVAETVSVMLQVASYKFLKRRLFKMAPIHHHFELAGWPETHITTRFGIITGLLCIIALSTLIAR